MCDNDNTILPLRSKIVVYRGLDLVNENLGVDIYVLYSIKRPLSRSENLISAQGA